MLHSILITLRNQKSKILLLFFAVLSIFFFSKTLIKYVWTYKSVIATTPATKSVNAVLQTVVESYNRSHYLSKIKMYEISNFDESLRLHNGEKADFAVVSPGTVIPNGFEVIASLNEEKVILISHKGNHFEQLKDIGNTTINIVNTNDYDEGVLRKLFDFFQIKDQQNKIDVISSDNFLASKILPNRLVYAFFLNPFSSTSSKMFKTKVKRLNEKFDMIEIDLAELVDYYYLFVSSTIKKGELSIHPLLPDEDVDTVSAFSYLVARASASEDVVYRMLTFLNASRKLIFDKISRDALLDIEGISESKNISFHRVYKKFLNGENEGFFAKYADAIYIAAVVLSAIFSFMSSNDERKKTEYDESYVGVLELFEDLERDWQEEMSSEDKKQILKIKKILSELIVNRSNRKDISINSLIGFMVLINIMTLFRKKGG